jgi:hypothetical protein
MGSIVLLFLHGFVLLQYEERKVESGDHVASFYRRLGVDAMDQCGIHVLQKPSMEIEHQQVYPEKYCTTIIRGHFGGSQGALHFTVV